MMKFNRIIKTLIIPLAISSATSAVAQSSNSWVPEIGGVIRARWEGYFDTSDPNDKGFEQRFQVRNVRVSLTGKIVPDFTYYVRVDFCDRGEFKFLDAWGKWNFAKGWAVQAGRFRVPFGVDCFKAPGTYIFTNRSMIGKTMLNKRQIGAKLGWYGTETIPLTIEGGMFNGNEATKGDWHRRLGYAAKMLWKSRGGFMASASFVSFKPYDVVINMLDAATGITIDRWQFEAEYQHKMYHHGNYKATEAYNVFGRYTIPIKKQAISSLSFEARFDGMTDMTSGKPNESGLLYTTDHGCQRITVGTTAARISGKLKAEINLDYEHYFANNSANLPHNNMITTELVVVF